MPKTSKNPRNPNHKPSGKLSKSAKSLLLQLLDNEANLDSDLDSMLYHVERVLRQEELPPEEVKETESWLDWGLDLLQKAAPALIKLAPELLALL